jgi:hypothetical protein
MTLIVDSLFISRSWLPYRHSTHLLLSYRLLSLVLCISYLIRVALSANSLSNSQSMTHWNLYLTTLHFALLSLCSATARTHSASSRPFAGLRCFATFLHPTATTSSLTVLVVRIVFFNFFFFKFILFIHFSTSKI